MNRQIETPEMLDIDEINMEIENYIKNHPEKAREFLLDIERFPQCFMDLADMLSDEEAFVWVRKRGDKAYNRHSPLETLSALNSAALKKNVEKMLRSFVYALGSCTINNVITSKQAFYETRHAQYEQLGLDKK